MSIQSAQKRDQNSVCFNTTKRDTSMSLPASIVLFVSVVRLPCLSILLKAWWLDFPVWFWTGGRIISSTCVTFKCCLKYCAMVPWIYKTLFTNSRSPLWDHQRRWRYMYIIWRRTSVPRVPGYDRVALINYGHADHWDSPRKKSCNVLPRVWYKPNLPWKFDPKWKTLSWKERLTHT